MKEIYTYKNIKEHIQFLTNYLSEEYPHNYEIIITPQGAELRSNITTLSFPNEKKLEELKNIISSYKISNVNEVVTQFVQDYKKEDNNRNCNE